MEFAFSQEQDQFRDTVTRFCRDKSPPSAVRKVVESGARGDFELWARMCGQLGLAGIHLPEDRGGLGFGPVELGIVMEELGRSLAPVPYLSSVLASTALARVEPSPATQSLMSAATAGEKILTLAVDARHGQPVSDEVSVHDGRLRGTARAVLDGDTADAVLIAVRDGGRALLYAAPADAQELTRQALRTLDGTRPVARLIFEDCAAEPVGALDDAAVTAVYDTALVALANEMVGGARALLDSTVEYTKMRVQFGRAIGSFQAIKHRLADLHTDVELARAAACQAAEAMASGEETSANASLAKAVAADAFMTAAREAIQLRGGIGFTWEDDTHLWYRRAKSSEVLLGTPAFHRERMLQEMNP